MTATRGLWLLAIHLPMILSSPFELTEQYVADFAKGIEGLKKVAAETEFKEGVYDPSKYNETEALKEAEEYDFIIVGSGASGSAIANRLTEIPEWKVLLLEAGEPETAYTQVPALERVLQSTPYNWGYLTEPQESWCLGTVDKRCSVASGKALGGSTVINSMMYTRGNPRDYDLWSDQGNEGWCYRDVLPFFKKAENAHLHNFDRKYHNQGGPVNVEEVPYRSPLVESFLEAGKELGAKVVDYNGKEQLGFGVVQATTKHGKRFTAAQAYLRPAKNRKNLVVRPLSHATEVIVNPHTKEAFGVKYVQDNKLRVAKAGKEVVLAAGAINSPQLLMLSGIGPKDELEKLKIPLVKEASVGRHVKDHFAFLGLNFLINETHSDHPNEHENLVTWLRDGTGPLSQIDSEAVAFLKTEASKEKTEYPDIELNFSPKPRYANELDAKHLRFKKEIQDAMWKPLEGKACFSIEVVPTQPKSTGTLHLKSKDPFHWPALALNHLSDPDDHDMATALAGIKKAIAISRAGAFKGLGAHLHPVQVPGCQQFEFGADEYWKCAVRHLSASLRHLTGTCRMGPATDKDAVVDNKLRVYGVHKLRVADPSVVPVSITGHINAAAAMIGEKAAHLIQEDWK